MTASKLTTNSASGALRLRCDEIQFAEAHCHGSGFLSP